MRIFDPAETQTVQDLRSTSRGECRTVDPDWHQGYLQWRSCRQPLFVAAIHCRIFLEKFIQLKMTFVPRVRFLFFLDFAKTRLADLKPICLFWVIGFLFSTLFSPAARGNENDERPLCPALETRLANPDRFIPLEKEAVPGCSYIELTIIFSDSWPQFVSNHIEYVDRDGVPVNFFRALRAKEEGNFVQAVRFSDLVFQKVIGVFLQSGDARRGGIYSILIVSWRNELISSLAGNSADWVEFLKESERGYLKKMGLEGFSSEVAPGVIFVCLLMSDPQIGGLQPILESRKFRECLLEDMDAKMK